MKRWLWLVVATTAMACDPVDLLGELTAPSPEECDCGEGELCLLTTEATCVTPPTAECGEGFDLCSSEITTECTAALCGFTPERTESYCGADLAWLSCE